MEEVYEYMEPVKCETLDGSLSIVVNLLKFRVFHPIKQGDTNFDHFIVKFLINSFSMQEITI